MQNFLLIAAIVLYLVCAAAFAPCRPDFRHDGAGLAAAWRRPVVDPGHCRHHASRLCRHAVVRPVGVGGGLLDGKPQLQPGQHAPSGHAGAALVVALQVGFPGNVVALEGKSPLFGWHIAIATMAYSTLTVAPSMPC
jgi:hypothetical protein